MCVHLGIEPNIRLIGFKLQARPVSERRGQNACGAPAVVNDAAYTYCIFPVINITAGA